ncbi:hypothetical protein CEXT_448531 [Caerostris extrusa]|uniref:Uncharacterized protein n=1 Tax=Caerostris extrusa TaxID=172846 RepID=A0AAV4R876_CAEEX|nr:hypothetical protein CEXT_448531 [Caerostris extrusa]
MGQGEKKKYQKGEQKEIEGENFVCGVVVPIKMVPHADIAAASAEFFSKKAGKNYVCEVTVPRKMVPLADIIAASTEEIEKENFCLWSCGSKKMVPLADITAASAEVTPGIDFITIADAFVRCVRKKKLCRQLCWFGSSFSLKDFFETFVILLFLSENRRRKLCLWSYGYEKNADITVASAEVMPGNSRRKLCLWSYGSKKNGALADITAASAVVISGIDFIKYC